MTGESDGLDEGFLTVKKPETSEEKAAYDLHYTFQFEFTQGHIRPGRLANPTPASLRPDTPLAFLKWHEAAYFLSLLEQSQHHQPAFYYHTDAFLVALHSTWDVVRTSRDDKAFAAWVETTWTSIRAHPELGPILVGGSKSLRNQALHDGLTPPPIEAKVTMRHHADGRITSDVHYQRVQLGAVSVENPVMFFKKALEAMKRILGEAAAREFLGLIPGFQPTLVTMEHIHEQPDGSWRPGPLGSPLGEPSDQHRST